MKAPKNGTPYVIAWFDPAGVDLNSYQCISFFVRAEVPGMVDLRLPDANWKTSLRLSSIAIAGGQWHRVRVPLTAADKQVLAGKIPDAKTQIAALRVWGMRQKGLLG